MPISSKELSYRLARAYPLLIDLRRAAIALNDAGKKLQKTRKTKLKDEDDKK